MWSSSNMGRPTKNINGEKADAFIALRVTSDMKEQIKEEAELKEEDMPKV